MARILLAPGKNAWYPGETLHAHVQVIYSHKAAHQLPLRMKDLSVEIVGVESIDPNWVSSSYHADVPIQAKQSRRILRDIFRSTASISGTTILLPGEKACYVIKCALPPALPPTFRGTSVRYTYHLKVSCRQSDAAMPADDADGVQLASAQVSTAHGSSANLQSAAGSSASRSLSRLGDAHGAEGNGAPHTDAGAPSGPAIFAPSSSRSSLEGVGRPVPLHSRSAGGGEGPGTVLSSTVDLPIWPRAFAAPEPPTGAAPSAYDADGSIPYVHYRLLSPEESPPIEVESFVVTATKSDESEVRSNGRRAAANRSAILWAPNRNDAPSSSGPASSTAHASRSNGHAAHDLSSSLPSLPPLVVDRTPSSRYLSGDAGTEPSTPTTQKRLSDTGGLLRTRTSFQSMPSSQKTYNLKLKEQHLVRVEIHPPREGSLCLGVTFTGTLDFQAAPSANSAAALPQLMCHQVVILLETEETINRDWLLPSHRKAGRCVVRQLYEEVLEVTQDQHFTSFMFTIPRFASPCFQTPLVALRWVLRFEFSAGSATADRWRKPEEIVWSLPLTVHAPPTGAAA